MKTKIYQYALTICNRRNWKEYEQEFYFDKRLTRLRAVYSQTEAYERMYSAWAFDDDIDIFGYFLEWLSNVTPKDLQIEFSEHEIIELLIADDS